VLLELIAHRYERDGLLITSNQAFSEWDSIFGDNTMTVVTIDRLVHHSDSIKYVVKATVKNKPLN
jgi:DNA replication protein DnaC